MRKSLQAILKSKEEIRNIKFLSNELIGLTRDSRSSLFDLLCEDEHGRSFIVEMQLGPYKDYVQRSKFYAFLRFNTLVKRGDFKFEGLTPIYCISFLAHRIFPESEHYYHHGTLKNQYGENLDDQITHIFLEIDKFNKTESELSTNLDKLLYMMKHQEILEKMKELPEVLSEDWIRQALEKFDTRKMSPEQQMFFHMMLAKNGSILAMEDEKKRRIAEEKKQIRLEAEKEGIEQGMMEEKRNIAKKLLEKGLDINFVAESTGLSVQEIEELGK